MPYYRTYDPMVTGQPPRAIRVYTNDDSPAGTLQIVDLIELENPHNSQEIELRTIAQETGQRHRFVLPIAVVGWLIHHLPLAQSSADKQRQARQKQQAPAPKRYRPHKQNQP